MAHTVYISLGSNIEPRVDRIQAARDWFSKRHELVAESSLYETEALGPGEQAWHINQVIAIRTEVSPDIVLADCFAVEDDIGRNRTEKWGPREIDVDILLYDSIVLDTVLTTGPNAGQALQIPHPELANRKFILIPLEEIAGNTIDPKQNKPISQLLSECADELAVRPYNEPT